MFAAVTAMQVRWTLFQSLGKKKKRITMSGMESRVFSSKSRLPLIIKAASSGRDLAAFVQENSVVLEDMLLEHAALLFRGFAVSDIADFDRFVAALTKERIDYIYSSTPRTMIGEKIFTATEYPAALEIPLHNECAYQRDWPLKLSLCCLVPAQAGGETPLADMRRVTTAVGERLLDKFEERGVQYVRHYHPYVDIPWQKAFQTEDREVVAQFCFSHGIDCEWIDNDILRTSQICQGTALHPVTDERFLFNQAHLFHVSSLGQANASALIRQFGPDRLPRQAYFGDGGELPIEDLEAVRHAVNAEAIAFPWQKGDVVLVDNMQAAHGRRPFSGSRKVIVALMEGYSMPVAA